MCILINSVWFTIGRPKHAQCLQIVAVWIQRLFGFSQYQSIHTVSHRLVVNLAFCKCFITINSDIQIRFTTGLIFFWTCSDSCFVILSTY